MKNIFIRLSATAFIVGLSITGATAQNIPDAGQTLQQEQPFTPPAPPSERYSPLEAQATDIEKADDDNSSGMRVLIKAVHIFGSTVFRAADLESLYSPMIGTEQSLKQLKQSLRLINNFYRMHGYVVARAYLPAQTIENGEITIQVFEGKLDKVILKNQSAVSDNTLKAMIGQQLYSGQLINGSRVNRALLSLNDLSGVGQVQGVLRAGEAVGTTSLIVDVPAGKSKIRELLLDNAGSRYTGQYRLSGYAQLNNLMHIGDSLDFRVSMSNESLAYTRVAWGMPLSNSSLRVGLNLAFNRYQLGDTFAELDAHGTSRTIGANVSLPLLLDVQRRIVGEVALEDRRLTDVVESVATNIDKQLQNAMLRLSGELSGSSWSAAWRAEGTLGLLNIDPPQERANDQNSVRTNGHFTKWNVSASILHSLSTRSSLYATISSQFARKNLDSSEKMVLGGIYGVRAYPAGEGLGDDGRLGSLEWRYRLLPTVQGVVFFDAGVVDVNHVPFVAGSNIRHLNGYGFALNTIPLKGLSLKMSVAWRGDNLPVSDKDQSPRAWVQSAYSF